VVAVSGLHVGIILSFFTFIMRLFSIRRSLSIFFGLILTWIYGALIGFPISVFRALIMFSIMYLGMLTHRRYDFFHSLFVAIIVILIINPLWIFDISFQLSFIAITSVGIFLNISKKYQFSKITKGIFFIIFIQCMILPVSIYYFNYIPVLSLMSNLLFVPVISISLFLSAAAIIINLFFPYFAEIFFVIINYILKASIYFFEKLSQIPINGINIYTPSFKEIMVYYIVLIIFVNGLLFKDEILRFFEIYVVYVLSLFLYIVIFMILPVSFDENIYISIIDVGQGASSFIKYKDTKFMIDAGGEVSRNYDRAGEVLPTYLLKRGIYSLDTVFLTHYHEDHYSGINEINDILVIDSIVSGYYNDEILSEFNGIKFYKINKGKILSLGSDFTIEILWPENDFFSSDENRNSLVMLLNFNGFNALFTGDIDEFVEKRIVEYLHKVDVLIVPHHGSKTSSGSEFVEKTKPDIAILSYGKNNYGIPGAEVIEKYLKTGSKIFSTFEHGEIVITVDKKGNYEVNYFNMDTKKDYVFIFIVSWLMVIFVLQVLNYKRSNEFYGI
jgi:competence protein ComEC